MADNSENEKSKLGLVLAIVAGLLAMGMVFVFLQKVKKDASGGKTSVSRGAERTKSVLVAVRDLPSGHTLSVNSDLEEMEIPVGKSTMEFTRQCVPSDRAAELEGRIIGVGIAAKFPLLYSNLIGSTRIDDDFKEGFLKSITISKVNLIGNQLIPGDRVVVLATIPKKDEESESSVSQPGLSPTDPSAMTAAILKSMPSMNPVDMKVETITVLENAEVFLVGSMRKIDRMQMGYFPAERDTASEITFRLNMVDALKLTQYENTPGANLSLLLRPRKSQK